MITMKIQGKKTAAWVLIACVVFAMLAIVHFSPANTRPRSSETNKHLSQGLRRINGYGDPETDSELQDTTTKTTPLVNGRYRGTETGRSEVISADNSSGTPAAVNNCTLAAVGEGSYAHAALRKLCVCNEMNTRAIRSWAQGVVTALRPRIAKSCEKLALNSAQEKARIRLALSTWQAQESEDMFRHRMQNCSNVRSEFSKYNFYNSIQEENFPISYVLVFHNNTQQILRLLKVLWRPQNLFCLHPDAKQSKEFQTFFRNFASCLDNVFIASKLERVIYAHHTIMDAQLNCMQDLLKYEETRWKYVITLCGTELPLRTNREIAASLQQLKGGTGIVTHALDEEGRKQRFENKIMVGPEEKVRFTNNPLGPLPHDIQIKKSWDFFALTRPFIHFILTDKKATDFRSYLRDVYIPEEHFFASLYWLKEAPDGQYRRDQTGIIPHVSDMVWINEKNRELSPPCAGRIVHGICILSSGDLNAIYIKGVLSHRNLLFYNKYFMHSDHVVMECMEERIVRQNKLEYIRDCHQ